MGRLTGRSNDRQRLQNGSSGRGWQAEAGNGGQQKDSSSGNSLPDDVRTRHVPLPRPVFFNQLLAVVLRQRVNRRVQDAEHDCRGNR